MYLLTLSMLSIFQDQGRKYSIRYKYGSRMGRVNWSSTQNSNLECIRLSLRKAICIITFKDKYEHSIPLFKELNILPLNEQIKHKQATFMWKLRNGYIPTPVNDLFTLNTSETITRTNINKYNLPNPRLDYGKRHITYSCVKLWNAEIPPNLKRITLYNNFSKKYKEFLLNSL